MVGRKTGKVCSLMGFDELKNQKKSNRDPERKLGSHKSN